MKCLSCRQPISGTAFHGLHQVCFQKQFKLKSPEDFTDLFARSTSSGKANQRNSPFKRFNTSFFHGQYKKYSATLGKETFILKVQQDEAPELPVAEYVSNQVARMLGLAVPVFYLILFNNKRFAFVTRNFMQDYGAATLDHIYKFIDESDPYTCEVLINVIKNQTGKLLDVARFVEICLFDSLVGNHDRHGRNLGFIHSRGKKILSPFYDNPTYIGIEDQDLLLAHHEPRGAIATHSADAPKMSDYLEEFSRLGFNNICIKFARKVITRFEAIIRLVDDSMLSLDRKKALISLIERRAQELENAAS